MVLPDHENIGDYLLKGGRRSALLGQYEKSVWFYDWMADDFSDNPNASQALFEKALVLKNNMNESYNSKNILIEYIRDYPQADSINAAKTYLKEMGWTE